MIRERHPTKIESSTHAPRDLDRPGHDRHHRAGPRRGAPRPRSRLPRVPPDLSTARLGGARPRRHLDVGHGLRARRGARDHRPQLDRRDRHHQPARDDRGVGPRDRRPDPPRDRVAGPPHRRSVREPQDPRAARPRRHRAHPRPVLQRHEDPLDARARRRRGRGGAGRQARVRHDRLVSIVAAHRRRGARDRRDQRVAHPVVRLHELAWSDEMLQARRRAAAAAAGSGRVGRACGTTASVPRVPDSVPIAGPCGDQQSTLLRPGVLRAGRRQVHVRHRRVHPR